MIFSISRKKGSKFLFPFLKKGIKEYFPSSTLIFFNSIKSSLSKFKTEEKVIRNAFIVDEGDAYNKILFDKSINNVKSKGLFKSVKSKILKSKNNNNKVINITVEEMPTGEIFAGVGTGTTGSSFSAGLKEKNYLGKGITLDTNFALSDSEVRGKFSVTGDISDQTQSSANHNRRHNG